MTKIINGVINEMDNREAMGLPEQFSPTKLDDLSAIIRNLFNTSTDVLCNIIESEEADVKTRYSAGLLLALQGDPRIDTHNPEMISIPAATARLGLNPDEVDTIVDQYRDYGVIHEWILKECPEYIVNLPAFKIGKYCITNQEYRDFLIDSGYNSLPSSWEFGVYPHHRANHPVYTLAPEDAEAYCYWLSQKTKRSFRLPTEQEWEYAAAGDSHTDFPWGNVFKPDHANTVEEQILSTTPVGMFPKGRSPFGVMDMAGNVEEYTASNYAAYPNGQNIADDLLVSEGDYRVARGGSYTRFRDLARTRRRHGWYKKAIYIMGFRLAETVDNNDRII